MIVIQVKIGGKLRKCTSRCYNAKTAACICICNGAHHSKGAEYAVAQAQTMVMELKRKRGRKKGEPEVVGQLPLI